MQVSVHRADRFLPSVQEGALNAVIDGPPEDMNGVPIPAELLDVRGEMPRSTRLLSHVSGLDSETIELDKLLAPNVDRSIKEIYDRIAPQYDRFRDLWIKHAGADAEKAFFETLVKIGAPNQRILDAGCGTGTVSRRIHALNPTAKLTMLDISSEMLSHAMDIPGEHLQGDVEHLPFTDNSFDIVVSTWVIETVTAPKKAVSEFLRVIRPQGYVLYTFCSLPRGWISRTGFMFLRKAMKKGFGGNFLSVEETPWHDCEASRLTRFHDGLTTFVVLRKCCSVGPEILPCLKASALHAR